jgi:Fe-S cluster biosynthesis and repair protein YggX
MQWVALQPGIYCLPAKLATVQPRTPRTNN